MEAGWSLAALWPGAVVAVLGGLLIVMLRRWLDPLPWWVAGVFGLLLATLFGPALLGGAVQLPTGQLTGFVPFADLPPSEDEVLHLHSDLVREIHPWQVQVRRAMSAGRWPLWNAEGGAGMPLLADPQSQALQPLVIAGWLVPRAAAPGVTAALRVLLALTGTFVLLRRQGLGEPAALFAALSYGLGGGLLQWLGWPIANGLALLPWALYAARRCDDRGGRRDWLLLGLAAAALLAGGHPETVLYALLLVLALLLAGAWRRRRSRRQALGFLGLGAATLGVAAALVSPASLPMREYLPATERAATIGAQFRWEQPWPEIWRQLAAELLDPQQLARWADRLELRLVSLVAPRALGDYDLYWGEGNFIEDAAAFAGTLTLLLALAGLAPVRRRLPGERLLRWTVLLAGLALAQPGGLARPLLRISLAGAGAIHQHHRLVLLAGFALCYLAACELERWRRGERRIAALTIAGAAVALLVTWAYLAHPRPAAEGPLGSTELPWLALQLTVLVAGGLALVLPKAASIPAWIGRAAAVALLLLAVAAELVAQHWQATRASPARLYYPLTPPLEFLARHLGDDRMLGLGFALIPNFGQVYGLADPRLHGPSRPASYDVLLSIVRHDAVPTIATYHRLGRLRHPLHDLLGVRFVLTPPGLELRLRRVFRRHSGWVYERPRPLPRLFLPRSARLTAAVDPLPWLTANGDFARRVLAEELPGGRSTWRARRPDGSSRLESLRLVEPERLSARAALAERRLLASSVYHHRGWRLLVDGAPRPVVRTNGVFVGGWLPPGARRLELLYRPTAHLAGCLLAALGWGVALAVAAAPPGVVGAARRRSLRSAAPVTGGAAGRAGS